MEKLRLQILKNELTLTNSTGVIVFDLPREGDENYVLSKQIERGVEDIRLGKKTECSDKARASVTALGNESTVSAEQEAQTGAYYEYF